MTAIKPKPCAASSCRRKFIPRRPLQRACSPSCALVVTRERAAKKAARTRRAQTRAAREALKTKPMLMAEAQTAFNAFIRERDKDRPCICCDSWGTGKPRVGGEWDAGHFLSVGSSPELRFDEDNCHRQLKACNRPGGTTRGKFRAGMIKRIGLRRLEILEGPHGTPNWTRDEIRYIRDRYRARLRELRSGST